MQELISIIIPVYNVEQYLDTCLKSVCAQTYKNLEILVVDDGSTDGSGTICDRWAEKDPRIKVIHKANGGVSSARNAGLKACTGEFIGFVDADDWLEPEMYEKLAETLHRDPRVNMVSCGYMDYPSGERISVPKGVKVIPVCGFADAVIAMFEKNGYFTAIWNKLFRRNVVFSGPNPLYFDETLSFGEDEVWLLNIMSRHARNAFIPVPMYNWRPREGSISRFQTVSEKQFSLLKAKKIALTLLPKRKDVILLAKSRTFNDCYYLKAKTYCSGDKRGYRVASNFLHPLMSAWLKSSDPELLRKIKVILMELLMRFHAPTKTVMFLSGITRYSFKR